MRLAGWANLVPTLVMAMMAGLPAPGAAAAEDAQLAAGKRLYREGRLPSGARLVAELPGGARLEGRQAACVTCHRKSGLGGSEGPVVIKPMTVPGFFSDQVNTRQYARRPNFQLHQQHYTDASFDRALRQGIAVDGRTLAPLMPRYRLDAQAVSALHAYLSSVALRPSPGVTDREIHFATIVAPDADPQVREATLQVLSGMVQARNAGSRSEKRRRQAGYDRMAVNWREWVLHVWELSGEPDSWAAQLARFNRDQPVFAVLSGAGRRWQPIHDFCERQELPCLFPNVDVPGRAEPGDYTLYLSGGVQLEAKVMARHLAAQGWNGPVWQIRGPDYRAEAGARTFAQAWEGKGPVRERVLHSGERIDRVVAELSADTSAALVLWLDGSDLDAPGPWQGPVVASGTLLGGVMGKPALGNTLTIVWPYALPLSEARPLDRVKHWLASRGIATGDERAQANTYLAAALAGDAVMQLGNNYSREYFIERIEHGGDKSPSTGAFPRIELGPGQRYASKGAYIVGSGDKPGRSQAVVPEWIVP